MKKVFSFWFAVLCVIAMSSAFFVSSAADLPLVNVTEATSTENEITLNWAKAKGAQGYKVYILGAEEKYEGVASTTELTYTVKNLTPNTKYTFKIRPFIKNEDGTKDFGKMGEPFEFKTRLKKITSVKVTSQNTTSVSVEWKAVKGAEYYRVQFKQKGEPEYVAAGDTTETKFTVKKLNGDAYYRIRVSAKCKGNSSIYSDSIVVYTTPVKLEKPVFKSSTSNSVKIGWTKNSQANLYYVYVATASDGEYKKVGQATGTTYTYKISSPKTAYWFKVAPVIKTDLQNVTGSKSSALKASTANITITAPEKVRKGEHPILKVPNYSSGVKWTTSNSKIIKVDGTKFYACGTGSVTLTAKYKNGSKSITYNVGAPVVTVMSCVYDVTNSRYIFENRKNEKCYPASITKLITALVALKYMDVNDTIVVGSELNMVESMSSRCGIQKGEKFKLGDLLYGLLLPSGGDAAYTIAVNCARKVSGKPNMGYVDAKNYFVSLMNKYMTSIGATGTHCVNPHGYPVNGHYSTVSDLVLVAKQVLKNKTLSKITSTPSKTVKALTGKSRTWKTTNSLITPGAHYYSQYARGMKTGTVNDNYTGIVSAATKGGKTYITVAIGCDSYNARYQKTRTLYNTYIV